MICFKQIAHLRRWIWRKCCRTIQQSFINTVKLAQVSVTNNCAWSLTCAFKTNERYLLTWVMFGANTMATLRAFILFKCSSCTTSAIKFIAHSSRAASVGGRSLTSRAHSSSDWDCITCSGGRESKTPLGSSLNQACRIINKLTECKVSAQQGKFSTYLQVSWQYSQPMNQSFWFLVHPQYFNYL